MRYVLTLGVWNSGLASRWIDLVSPPELTGHLGRKSIPGLWEGLLCSLLSHRSVCYFAGWIVMATDSSLFRAWGNKK